MDGKAGFLMSGRKGKMNENRMYLLRRGDCLVPSTDIEMAWLKNIPDGAGVSVTARKARSVKFHRKFMAMLSAVYRNKDWPSTMVTDIKTGEKIEAKTSFDSFRRYITIKCGFYDYAISPSGHASVQARSIAFANMNQHDFNELYNNAVQVVLDEILPQWNEQDIENAIKFVREYG